MTREMDPDRKGPAEFFKFAAKRFLDDLEPLSMLAGAVSIVVGAVFGAVWFLGAIFRKASTSTVHKEQ